MTATIVMAGAVAVDFTGFLDPTAGTFTVDGAVAAGVAG